MQIHSLIIWPPLAHQEDHTHEGNWNISFEERFIFFYFLEIEYFLFLQDIEYFMVDCCVDLWAVIHGQPAVFLLIGIGTLQILYNWQIFVYILVHIMYCIYVYCIHCQITVTFLMGTSLTSIAKRLAMQMLRPDYTNPWYRPLFVPTCRNVGSKCTSLAEFSFHLIANRWQLSLRREIWHTHVACFSCTRLHSNTDFLLYKRLLNLNMLFINIQF